mmetsp:Transcript_36348/g.46278  ORF Transcript_36348/g.46278 Transcript_36348/m.46278 type:complete len:113 (-) Transcript_36348:294-632(-)
MKLKSLSFIFAIVLLIASINAFQMPKSISRAGQMSGKSLQKKSLIPTTSRIPPRNMDIKFVNTYSKKEDSESEVSEKNPFETKYLIGWGVLVFAVLYDFFVTHGGQPYLAHP